MATGLRASQNGIILEELDGRAGYKIEEVRENMSCGSGITAGTGTLYRSRVTMGSGIVQTDILIDLTGLKSGATAGDIIGASAAANCNLGQITDAKNGKLFAGTIYCLEAPATGEPDIDVASASVATGTQDAAASGLSGYVLNQDHAADYTAQGHFGVFTTVPVANSYLYLVTSGGADTAVYTAGIFLIRLLGYEL